MTKLHQRIPGLAPLITDRDNAVKKAVSGSIHSRGSHDGLRKVYTTLNEGGTEKFPENLPVAIRAWESLSSALGAIALWLNRDVEVETANQSARADLVVGGIILAANVPATALLHLERVLSSQIRQLIGTAPVLDTAKVWHWDAEIALWLSEPEQRMVTEKVAEPITLSAATEKHPARVELVTLDKQVGYWVHTKTSAAFAASQVREMESRLQTLLLATKQAREEANQAESIPNNLGNAVKAYLLGGN